jgi:hypothetical protein
LCFAAIVLLACGWSGFHFIGLDGMAQYRNELAQGHSHAVEYAIGNLNGALIHQGFGHQHFDGYATMPDSIRRDSARCCPRERVSPRQHERIAVRDGRCRIRGSDACAAIGAGLRIGDCTRQQGFRRPAPTVCSESPLQLSRTFFSMSRYRRRYFRAGSGC